ncbi:MAG: ORF6N domain-containing protein [Desulfovibrionaceae bacterium]|nr:ORF6N domain-containing protein [Desulfovibrionaceae bacterium]
MPDIQQTFSLDAVAKRIFEIRGQRIMLDADLAVLYGVETGALVRAVKRNLDRFPEDFIFRLSSEEWDSLRCQFGILNTGRGQHRKYLPWVFTEHGSLMLAGILNSPRAKEISVLIIRAFVWLRQAVPAHKELAVKVAELENAVGQHDEAIKAIVHALQQMMTPPGDEQRQIGFRG